MHSKHVTWPIGNSLLLDVVAPLDYIVPSVPAAIGGAVNGVDDVTGYLFSKRVKSVLTGGEAASALTITVESVEDLVVTDNITIEESDGSFTKHPVTDVDATTKIITFTTGLTAGAKTGARYWKTYGSDSVVGVEYGTPDADETDWGYVYEFPYTYDSDLRRDENLEAMAVLHLASTGAHYTEIWDVIMAESGAP